MKWMCYMSFVQVSALKIVTATHSVISGGSEGDRHSLPSYWTTSIHHDANFVIGTLGQSELIKPMQEPWGSSDDLDLSNSGSHILHLPFLSLML